MSGVNDQLDRCVSHVVDKRCSLACNRNSRQISVSSDLLEDIIPPPPNLTAMPTHSEYEASLRNAVRLHYANPNEEATVRTMRTKSEQDLGLDEGFYKNDDVWKEKSKEIIQDQVNKCEMGQAENTEEPVENKKSLKRASPVANSRPRKKSKLEEEDESTALSEPPETVTEEDSVEEDYAPKKKAVRKSITKTTKAAGKPKTVSAKKVKPTAKPKKDSSTSELSDAPSEDLSEPPEDTTPSKANEDNAEDSSSELSSVIDEPSARKSSKSKNGSASKPSTSKSASKSKTKASAESDPKAEEIKRLQGWLAKCGIRKVWGKELKPFGTQNAKISHLKSLLSDVGMTGRYSNEKAAQIKEARELAADMEAVQEGNERWGKDGEDDEEQPDRGGRRLVRGAKNYAFLSSDGEEESD